MTRPALRAAVPAALLVLLLGSCASGQDAGSLASGEPASGPGASASASTGAAGPSGSSGEEATPGPEESPTLEPRPAAVEEETDEVLEEYPDDPEPADEVLGTLCNLTQAHMEELDQRLVGGGGNPRPENLRLALISLGDDLAVWEGIAWHVPRYADHIVTAQRIYERWDLGLALLESGDRAAAQQQLEEASQAIGTLPGQGARQLGCS